MKKKQPKNRENINKKVPVDDKNLPNVKSKIEKENGDISYYDDKENLVRFYSAQHDYTTIYDCNGNRYEKEILGIPFKFDSEGKVSSFTIKGNTFHVSGDKIEMEKEGSPDKVELQGVDASFIEPFNLYENDRRTLRKFKGLSTRKLRKKLSKLETMVVNPEKGARKESSFKKMFKKSSKKSEVPLKWLATDKDPRIKKQRTNSRGDIGYFDENDILVREYLKHYDYTAVLLENNEEVLQKMIKGSMFIFDERAQDVIGFQHNRKTYEYDRSTGKLYVLDGYESDKKTELKDVDSSFLKPLTDVINYTDEDIEELQEKLEYLDKEAKAAKNPFKRVWRNIRNRNLSNKLSYLLIKYEKDITKIVEYKDAEKVKGKEVKEWSENTDKTLSEFKKIEKKVPVLKTQMATSAGLISEVQSNLRESFVTNEEGYLESDSYIKFIMEHSKNKAESDKREDHFRKAYEKATAFKDEFKNNLPKEVKETLHNGYRKYRRMLILKGTAITLAAVTSIGGVAAGSVGFYKNYGYLLKKPDKTMETESGIIVGKTESETEKLTETLAATESETEKLTEALPETESETEKLTEILPATETEAETLPNIVILESGQETESEYVAPEYSVEKGTMNTDVPEETVKDSSLDRFVDEEAFRAIEQYESELEESESSKTEPEYIAPESPKEKGTMNTNIPEASVEDSSLEQSTAKEEGKNERIEILEEKVNTLSETIDTLAENIQKYMSETETYDGTKSAQTIDGIEVISEDTQVFDNAQLRSLYAEYKEELNNLKAQLPQSEIDLVGAAEIGSIVNVVDSEAPIYQDVYSVTYEQNGEHSYFGDTMPRVVESIVLYNGTDVVNAKTTEQASQLMAAGYEVTGYSLINPTSNGVNDIEGRFEAEDVVELSLHK